eukprot:SAG31_NODE_21484_length_548_cov_1.153675_1_plen_50_part_10
MPTDISDVTNCESRLFVTGRAVQYDSFFADVYNVYRSFCCDKNLRRLDAG